MHLFPPAVSETKREAALWVKVDEQYATTELCKRCAKADSCCCLTDATLLIEDRDDLRLPMLCNRSWKREVLGCSPEE